MLRGLLKREVFILKKKVFAFLFCIALCSQFFFSKEYSVFCENGLYGIIDENRNVIMEPNYNSISINDNSIITYMSKDRITEIYNKSLELLFSDFWVNLTFYSEDKILIKESQSGNRYLLDLITGVKTEFNKYKNVYGYRDNVGLIEGNKVGSFSYSIADINGNVLLTDIVEAHSVYTNGMIAVIMRDGKSGFVNQKGEMVIEADFYIEPSDIGPRAYPIIRYLFNENYALVKNNEQKWVQYDIEGNVKPIPGNIEPATYCYIKGLVPVLDKQTKKYGYMNPELQIVIPCEFDSAEPFDGKYAIVVKDGKDAVIDKEGKIYYCDEF